MRPETFLQLRPPLEISHATAAGRRPLSFPTTPSSWPLTRPLPPRATCQGPLTPWHGVHSSPAVFPLTSHPLTGRLQPCHRRLRRPYPCMHLHPSSHHLLSLQKPAFFPLSRHSLPLRPRAQSQPIQQNSTADQTHTRALTQGDTHTLDSRAIV